MTVEILVLYYTHKGATAALAEEIAFGVDSVADCAARIRTVPSVSATPEATEAKIPTSGAPFATKADLAECHGLALGSPTRFGNMAAPLKYFIDGTASEWLRGEMVDKPFSVFTSSTSMHGGQETTLLSMALPLMHHGMFWVGVPYLVKELNSTRTGGTPYGASHVAFDEACVTLSADETAIARSLGARLGSIAKSQSRNG